MDPFREITQAILSIVHKIDAVIGTIDREIKHITSSRHLIDDDEMTT